MTREEIVAEARSWIGTRWQHQGRTRSGVDCVGLIIEVTRACRLVEEYRLAAVASSTAGYSRYPSGPSLKNALDAELHRTSVPQPGDVALLRMDGEIRHVGIFGSHPSGGLSLIHSYAMAPRRVVEHLFDRQWQGRLVASYGLPGVG